MLCCVVLCCVVLFCVVLCCVVLCCVVLYCILYCCVVLYCIVAANNDGFIELVEFVSGLCMLSPGTAMFTPKQKVKRMFCF